MWQDYKSKEQIEEEMMNKLTYLEQENKQLREALDWATNVINEIAHPDWAQRVDASKFHRKQFNLDGEK